MGTLLGRTAKKAKNQEFLQTWGLGPGHAGHWGSWLVFL